MMHLYQFIDDDTHLIAAQSDQHALAFYLREINGDGEPPGDLKISAIDPAKWPQIRIGSDDGDPSTTAAQEVGDAAVDRDAFLVGSTLR